MTFLFTQCFFLFFWPRVQGLQVLDMARWLVHFLDCIHAPYSDCSFKEQMERLDWPSVLLCVRKVAANLAEKSASISSHPLFLRPSKETKSGSEWRRAVALTDWKGTGVCQKKFWVISRQSWPKLIKAWFPFLSGSLAVSVTFNFCTSCESLSTLTFLAKNWEINCGEQFVAQKGSFSLCIGWDTTGKDDARGCRPLLRRSSRAAAVSSQQQQRTTIAAARLWPLLQ